MAYAIIYPILIGLFIICIVAGRYEGIINDALRQNNFSSEWEILRIVYYFIFGFICFGTLLSCSNKDSSFMNALGKQYKLFVVDLVIAIVVSVFILIYLYKRLKIEYYKELLRYVKKIEEVKEKLSAISDMKKEHPNDLLLSSEKVLKKSYKDLEQSYQAAILLETFKTLNDFQMTRDTKDDLVTQIDICENMRKL